jgi:hypothetical protein
MDKILNTIKYIYSSSRNTRDFNREIRQGVLEQQYSADSQPE